MPTKQRKSAMNLIQACAASLLVLACWIPAHGDDTKSAAKPKPESLETAAGKIEVRGGKPVSFMRDVAPILVRNCIACHNPKKSESKYLMMTFAQLAKGGK